ncbi:MAG: hypothetical protein V9F04_04140 [Dermatophilaceae bacterium]
MLGHSPEFTYSRLLEAADLAKKLGAQVMGLGAFTKVVGDAGVTVAKRAPLPVTTGNSYSASGALWAAHDAMRKLGIAELGEDGQIHGKAMVVGATGAIGSVCARLLALVTDELWLVSPETAKLLAIKHEIEQENPRAVAPRGRQPGRGAGRDGSHRHGHLGGRQPGARHHEGQARVCHHRRRASPGHVGRGRRQAAGRPGHRVGRGRPAR